MKVSVRESSGVKILDLNGKLVMGSGDYVLRGAVRQELEGGAKSILLNLRDVTGLDSAGLGEMVSSYSASNSRDAKLKLFNVPQRILDLLYITKLITVFEVFDTEDEAVASFK